MNEVIHTAFGVTLTPWKLVGYLGVLLFAGRWFVQMYYSRKYRKPVVPTTFWLMSISGSLLLLVLLHVRQERLGRHPLEPVPGRRRWLQPVPRPAPQAQSPRRRGYFRRLSVRRSAGSRPRSSVAVSSRHLPTGSVPRCTCMIRTRCSRRTV